MDKPGFRCCSECTFKAAHSAREDEALVGFYSGGGYLDTTVTAPTRCGWGGNPVGRRFKFGGPDGPNTWFEIVGVTAEVKPRISLADPRAYPQVYTPIFQRPAAF